VVRLANRLILQHGHKGRHCEAPQALKQSTVEVVKARQTAHGTVREVGPSATVVYTERNDAFRLDAVGGTPAYPESRPSEAACRLPHGQQAHPELRRYVGTAPR
jgi:hypothetical protein